MEHNQRRQTLADMSDASPEAMFLLGVALRFLPF